jgi:hypothetical protein
MTSMIAPSLTSVSASSRNGLGVGLGMGMGVGVGYGIGSHKQDKSKSNPSSNQESSPGDHLGTSLEIIAERDLKFFKGTAKGSVTRGFMYNDADKGAKALSIQLAPGLLSGSGGETCLDPVRLKMYCHGAPFFDEASVLSEALSSSLKMDVSSNAASSHGNLPTISKLTSLSCLLINCDKYIKKKKVWIILFSRATPQTRTQIPNPCNLSQMVNPPSLNATSAQQERPF